MNANEARERLPEITVRVDSDIYPARVTGRKERFAVVTFYVLGGKLPVSVDCAWETVARAATNGTPIIAV